MIYSADMTPEQYNKTDELSIRNIEFHSDNINTTVKNINNIIFVLAAGTFAVSISFIGYLKTAPKDPCLLILAWGFLLGAICGNVSVHYLSSKSSGRYIKEINDYRANNFTPHWNMTETKDETIKLIRKWTNGLTIFVFLCLFLGLVFLMAFGGINLVSQGSSQQDIVNYTPTQDIFTTTS